MKWSDISTRFYNLTKTNSTSMSNANLDSYIQPATERVVALINRSDLRWQFDDSNYSDLPIATTQLNSGQQDYSLATTHLTIDRAEVSDSSGNWTVLTPIDEHDIRLESLESHLQTNGVPREIDIVGNSVFLYPIPNYTLAGGLKLYFTRGPLVFSYATGTFSDSTGSTSSSPGFNELFHDLIPLYGAYDYWTANNPTMSAALLPIIQSKEQECDAFYGTRNRLERRRMTVSTNRSYGSSSGMLNLGTADSNR